MVDDMSVKIKVEDDWEDGWTGLFQSDKQYSKQHSTEPGAEAYV
jgi:hypothetical protein